MSAQLTAKLLAELNACLVAEGFSIHDSIRLTEACIAAGWLQETRTRNVAQESRRGTPSAS